MDSPSAASLPRFVRKWRGSVFVGEEDGRDRSVVLGDHPELLSRRGDVGTEDPVPSFWVVLVGNGRFVGLAVFGRQVAPASCGVQPQEVLGALARRVQGAEGAGGDDAVAQGELALDR